MVEPVAEEARARSFAGPASPSAIVLSQPSYIPTVIAQGGEDSAPEAIGNSGGCSGCVATTGLPDGISGILGKDRPMPLPARPSAPITHQFRASSMLQGYLLHTVQPVYPSIARTARIQGPVVLAAIINRQGEISDLRVISGHPMLVAAAIDAVKKWRYKPYVLNNETIEVETQITVNFTLAGN